MRWFDLAENAKSAVHDAERVWLDKGNTVIGRGVS
jgi:hypothetical protein